MTTLYYSARLARIEHWEERRFVKFLGHIITGEYITAGGIHLHETDGSKWLAVQHICHVGHYPLPGTVFVATKGRFVVGPPIIHPHQFHEEFEHTLSNPAGSTPVALFRPL